MTPESSSAQTTTTGSTPSTRAKASLAAPSKDRSPKAGSPNPSRSLADAKASNQPALIITGEGAFDEQSLTGKVVGTIAEIAEDADATLAIVAGRMDSPEPKGALSSQLSQQGTMHEQLKEAGRAIAEKFSASLA